MAQRNSVDVEIARIAIVETNMLAIGTLKPEGAHPLRQDTDIEHESLLGRKIDRGIQTSQRLLVEHGIHPDANNPVTCAPHRTEVLRRLQGPKIAPQPFPP